MQRICIRADHLYCGWWHTWVAITFCFFVGLGFTYSCNFISCFEVFFFLVCNLKLLQVQEVYDEAGVLGFWKGVFPTLIMVSEKWFLYVLREHR